MKNIFCLVGNNKFLTDLKIKELTQKSTIISFKKNSQKFFEELQKKNHNHLLGDNFDIVFKNVENLKEIELKSLISSLRNIKKNKIIFVFNLQNEKIFSLLKENKLQFEIINLTVPNKRNLDLFIKNFLNKYKIKIPLELINFLKENYDQNFDLLLQDLNKIIALRKEKPTIKELEELITFNPNIFKINDFFIEKNWPYFIHYFKKLIFETKNKENYEIQKYLSLLFNSLIKIYLLKNNSHLKLKGHFYYLNRLKEKTNHLTNEEIKKLIFSLAQTERKLKKFAFSEKEIPENIFLNYLYYFYI